MFVRLIVTLVLIKLGECSKPDFMLSDENGTDYEMVYFNLDKFESFSIIEFDYRKTHYEVELIKNRHISPIINHQTDKNITVTQDRKTDDTWYEHISYGYKYTVNHVSPFCNMFCKQSLSWFGIELST